jgi:hypothetical protein
MQEQRDTGVKFGYAHTKIAVALALLELTSQPPQPTKPSNGTDGGQL